MIISILGTGNVATIMGRLCKQNGHSIHQIIAKNVVTGNVLAAELGATCIAVKENIDKKIDLLVVAISDNALQEAMTGINFDTVPIVHTAGALSMSVLVHNSKNIGVLYPLQSLRKEMQTLPVIPFLIESNNEQTLGLIKTFAQSISNNVQEVNEEQRLRLHTAAVIVSNFTNYLYGTAELFCTKENVDFNLLKPLIKETAIRIENISPLEVQTGPAKRKDIIIIAKHLRLLEAHPKLRILYTRLSDGIMND